MKRIIMSMYEDKYDDDQCFFFFLLWTDWQIITYDSRYATFKIMFWGECLSLFSGVKTVEDCGRS